MLIVDEGTDKEADLAQPPVDIEVGDIATGTL